jgi:hypothetical protein
MQKKNGLLYCYQADTVWQIFFLTNAERRNRMLRQLQQNVSPPKEGDLYKVIHLHGETFEIRYGFYEECDRNNQFAEPIEIYPDFLQCPRYTTDGAPFVTAIQNPCPYFNGRRTVNSTCEDCSHYQHGEELLGVCACPRNQKTRALPKEDI